MKAKLLTLFSLLALLLVSTAILADGRPTGIRIGRVANVGASGVEIDITVPGTTTPYSYWGGATTVWIGYGLGGVTTNGFVAWQYASPTASVPLPWAIDWGDGSRYAQTVIAGPPGGPFTGTFRHTYPPAGMPQTFTITVGDALCCSPNITSPSKGAGITTGNVLTGSLRYLKTFGVLYDYYPTFNSISGAQMAVTNTATVTTFVGIPTNSTYGLIALALLLVGSGLLVFRRPQRTVA